MITYVWPPQSVAVAVPPVQFLKNGANQTVIEDTAVPANNNPLPAGMYILKDGIAYPVGIDTVTPANTISVPVRLESATGPINITAGDLNVQLSDAGANFDATRIGDGSGIYLQVNADGSINVQDAAALAKLTTLAAVDFATAAKQDLAKTVLDNSLIKLTSIDAKDFSTAAKQDLAKAVLDNIKTNGDTLNLKDFSTATNQAALAVLTGPVTETAPATDTASSGLNGRLQRIAQRITSLLALLPTSLGQKTKANSLAIVPASDYQFPVTPYNIDLTVAPVSALNGDLVPSVDVSGYKVIYLQNMNSFTGTCTFQGSMDGTLWNVVPANPVSSISVVTASTFNGLSTGLFAVPITFKYFRLRVTAYTSGTGNVLAMASTVAVPDYATKFFSPNGTIPTSNSTVAGTVSSAQVSVGTTAVRATVAGAAPNAARKLLLIKPSKNNSGAIYIGPSTVTAANGMEILGPDRVEFDFDAGDYYLISDTVGQTVEILEKI